MTTEIRHLTEAQLSAMVDGELKGEALWRAEQHLASCEACRDALADLSARDAALGTALSNEPGEDYFASFADRVVGRIASAEAAGASAESAARDAERRPFARAWWESPRRLAMVGGVAVVVLGAGIVLMTAREAPLPKVAERSHVVGVDRDAGVKPEAAAPAEPPAATMSAPSSETRPEDRAATRQKVATSATKPAAPAPASALPRSAGTRMVEVPRDGRREAGARKISNFAAPPPAPAPGRTTTAARMSQLKKNALAPAKLQATKDAKEEAAAAPQAAAPSAAALDQVRADRDERGTTCGTVRDDQGRPLAGVEVTAIDVARSTRTGADGRFCLDLPAGEHTLQALAVGFRAGRIAVPANGGNELAVTLAPVEVLGGSRGAVTSRGFASPSRATEPQPTAGSAALSTLSGGEGAIRAFPAALRDLAADAARLQASASSQAGATGYDTAAAAWERVLSRSDGGSPDVEIRARIAECRYLAWRRVSDRRHTSMAIEALTAFIGRVPVGERQNLAARWLDLVRAR